VANEPRRIKRLLEIVTDDIDKCTEWEQAFLRSVEEQFRKKGALTDSQYDTLEKIYTERCQ